MDIAEIFAKLKEKVRVKMGHFTVFFAFLLYLGLRLLTIMEARHGHIYQSKLNSLIN